MQLMKYWFITLIFLVSCSKTEIKKAPSLTKVEVAEAITKDFPLYIEAIGNVYEHAIVKVEPQVQGILLKAYVAQGQFVKEGELLYEIDSRPYKAILDEAKATLSKDEASLELAKLTLKRNAELAKKNFISELSYEQFQTNVKTTEAQVEIDKAAVEAAQINFDYTRIVSPIDGKISVYNIYPGNLVVVNDPAALTEIRQIVPVDVRFSLPQKDFQAIQRYQTLDNLKLEASLPYENDRTFEGHVYFVDNHIDVQTGTILIKGVFPNQNLELWPGEFVKVRIYLTTIDNATVVPSAAVQIGQKGPYVYVVKPDMTAEAINVTTGQQVGEQIQITSGVNVGDKVVTNGQLNLRSGMKVEVSTLK